MGQSIKIQGQGTDYLEIEISGRESGSASNWLKGTVTINKECFRGKVRANFETYNWSMFQESLLAFLSGGESAEFESTEPYLSLFISRDVYGLLIKGSLQDAPETGDKLEFNFYLDEDTLPYLAEQVKAVVKSFPEI